MKITFLLQLTFSLFFFMASNAQNSTAILEPMDVFELEFVSHPQISPDGQQVIYARNFKDIMTDRNLSNLWMVKTDGTQHHPLTTGNQKDSSPLWLADGKGMLYVSNRDGKAQLYRRWLDSGAEAKLTNLQSSPNNLTLSPDGNWIAFTMAMPAKDSSLIQLPSPPKGATWAAAPKYISTVKYRADGAGFLKNAFQQIFILSLDGGTPRQLTDEPLHHGDLEWSKDGQSILFSTNRHEDAQLVPNNSEIYELSLSDGQIKTLTTRFGPDSHPKISPDGRMIAYTGLDDKFLGYQTAKLYIMNRDGSNPRLVTKSLDRGVGNIHWAADGKGLYFQYDEEGNTKIAHTTLEGKVTVLAQDVGGMSLGRPYSGGTFSVAKNGTYAFTHSRPDHPADLAVGSKGNQAKRLTHLNDDLFTYKKLGEVEEIWYESSHDKQKIQGWICKPPNFDPNKKYPLILEIHGGPFANYGDRFSSEVQLYAAAGYVVLYTNPRGSSSYGADFGNLIHHNYPGQDYDDLISGVDAVIEKGYVDENQLFVTGGSGGGVLTAWIIGKTNRFQAAVVAKPVINWYSFVLHADNPAFFYKYWFPGKPWEHTEHYMQRSPISLVGNVQTPTMLLTGEQDYRTPMSETEQYYAALQLNGVESAMVRIQEAGHGIAARPSNLMAKVLYVLGWFEEYKK